MSVVRRVCRSVCRSVDRDRLSVCPSLRRLSLVGRSSVVPSVVRRSLGLSRRVASRQRQTICIPAFVKEPDDLVNSYHLESFVGTSRLLVTSFLTSAQAQPTSFTRF